MEGLLRKKYSRTVRDLRTCHPCKGKENPKSSSFYYRTSRETVYKLVDKYERRADDRSIQRVPTNKRTLEDRDHDFDRSERTRVLCMKKVATVSTDRNAVERILWCFVGQQCKAE